MTQRARAGAVAAEKPRDFRGAVLLRKKPIPAIGADVDTRGGSAGAVTRGQIGRAAVSTLEIPFIAAVQVDSRVSEQRGTKRNTSYPGVGVSLPDQAVDVVRHAGRPAAEHPRSRGRGGGRDRIGPRNHGQTQAE